MQIWEQACVDPSDGKMLDAYEAIPAIIPITLSLFIYLYRNIYQYYAFQGIICKFPSQLI